MKLNLTDFLRKCQFPPMIALGLLPLPTLLLLQSAPDHLWTLFVLIPTCVLLCWLCMILPGKIRIPCALAGCAAFIALSFHLLPILESLSPSGARSVRIGQGALALFIPLLLCLLLLYSLRFSSWPREREIAFNWYAAGVLTHLFYLFVRAFPSKQVSNAASAADLSVTVAFVAFLLLVLLSMNRATMAAASLRRQRVPHSMRRRNVLITLSILSITLVVAGIEPLMRLLRRISAACLRVIRAILALIARFLETDRTPAMPGGNGGGSQGMPSLPYEEPSLFAKVMDLLVMIVASLLAAILVYLALRILLRGLRTLLANLRARLMRYLASASEDYIDEISDTRDAKMRSERSRLSKLRSRFAYVDESKLTPNARIRYRYARLLKKHPDWQQSRTARENLPHEAAILYEQARYSGTSLSPEAAEEFSGQIRHIP